jgi:predicted  nucleic acid-binding Zn-ribbon protein
MDYLAKHTIEYQLSETQKLIDTGNELTVKIDKYKQQSELPTVATDGGLFGLFDHKVTGEELNNLTSKINYKFDDQLAAIETIDKNLTSIQYAMNISYTGISQKICVIIDSIRKIIFDLSEDQDKIEKHQREIDVNTADIKQLIENMDISIRALKKFKVDIEKIKNLNNIDKMSDSINSTVETVKTFNNYIKTNDNFTDRLSNRQIELSKKVSELQELNKKHQKFIDSLIDIKRSIESYKHLNEIDEMWDLLEKLNHNILSIQSDIETINNHINDNDTSISTLNTSIISISETVSVLSQQLSEVEDSTKINTEKISDLLDYKEKLSQIVHLDNVDELWETTSTHTTHLNSLQKEIGDLDRVYQERQKQNDTAVKKVSENIQQYKSQNDSVISELTNEVALNKSDVEAKISDIYDRNETALSEITANIQKNKEQNDSELSELNSKVADNNSMVESKIADIDNKTEHRFLKQEKQLKISFLVAGGSFCLALIELIILLVR